MDACLIILNCVKFANKRAKQRSTWLNTEFPIKLWYHIIGDSTIIEEYKIDTENNIIYVNCNDNYESLSQKTYLAIKAVIDYHPSVNYIFKTDDDENCNIVELKKHMNIINDNRYDYGGHFNNVNIDHTSTYHYQYFSPSDRTPWMVYKAMYAIGRFYFLSKRAAECILKQRDIFWKVLYEDNAVGHALNNLEDIKIYRIPDKTIFSEF